MRGERTRQLIEELRIWVNDERGRRAQIARVLGIEAQVVTHWLAGRQNPTSEQTLALLEFLKGRWRA